ncbi:MAG: TonB-dependent receptor, partial [Sulfurospirillum sp.]
TLSGGKIGLKYQASKDKLFYIALSKGYKPGGVNPNNSLPKNARSFDTESLYNLDLGVNSSHLGDRLKSRLNLFYGKRKDQQVKSSMVNLRDDGSSEFIDFIANAAKTHYYGLESEITFQANDSLRFFSSIGLLKAEFDEYKDPNPNSIDVEGRAPAQSPKYQYDIGVDYFVGEHIKLSSDIEGKGSYYFSNRHNAKAPSYSLLNASATVYDGSWSLSLWGRNLNNKDYEVRGFGSFGNNPAKGYATETYTQKGDPRTYGLTLSYDY